MALGPETNAKTKTTYVSTLPARHSTRVRLERSRTPDGTAYQAHVCLAE